MNATEQTHASKTTEKAGQGETPRLLTPTELGVCIRLFREMRQWSQEHLAAIAGINVRTIQRVEQGQAASVDTRRAWARAFECEDIDVLNKPFSIPTPEQVQAHQEKFAHDRVTLKALPLATGKELARLAEAHMMDLSGPAFEMGREADEAFAALVDYFPEYRDCADLYSEVDKFDIYDEMQSWIDALKKLGVSLCYAERKMQVKWGNHADSKPMPVSVLYVVAFPLGNEPAEFATPKSGGIRL